MGANWQSIKFSSLFLERKNESFFDSCEEKPWPSYGCCRVLIQSFERYSRFVILPQRLLHFSFNLLPAITATSLLWHLD